MKYPQLIKNTDEDIVSLLSREFYDSTRYKLTECAIATTWVMSFKHIEESDTDPATLLSFISSIGWIAIPRSILPSIEPEARMIDALGTICSYSFAVKRENEDTYDMHRLVHLATRVWVNRNNRLEEVKETAIQHVAEVFPYVDRSTREIWKNFLPHAVQISAPDTRNVQEVKANLWKSIALRSAYINVAVRNGIRIWRLCCSC